VDEVWEFLLEELACKLGGVRVLGVEQGKGIDHFLHTI
jgi:hypothetical protein